MSDFESAKGFCARPPRSARLRAGARFALAPGLPRNDVGHEKVTRGVVVDSRAYRRPTRITRRHLFRVGQRAARSVPERRSAKFRRASRFLLVQGRQRAQGVEGRRQSLLGWALHHLMISTASTFWFSGPIMKCTRQSRRIRSHAKRKASSFRGARSSHNVPIQSPIEIVRCSIHASSIAGSSALEAERPRHRRDQGLCRLGPAAGRPI
jgi:hypothetical protein